MTKNISLLIIGAFAFLLSACKSGMKPENLRGKWKYVKVFNPTASPPDSVTTGELTDKKPYIEFTGDNKLQIIWGGEVLSHGVYRIDGKNLAYTEDIGNGETRDFPFFVSKLSEKEITFETLGADGQRVIAVKE